MELFGGVGEGRVQSLFAPGRHRLLTGAVQESFKRWFGECCRISLVIVTEGPGINDSAAEDFFIAR